MWDCWNVENHVFHISIIPRSKSGGNFPPRNEGVTTHRMSYLQRHCDTERTQENQREDDTGLDMQRLLIPVYRIRTMDRDPRTCHRKSENEQIIRNEFERIIAHLETILSYAREIIDETTETSAIIENVENILDYARERAEE